MPARETLAVETTLESWLGTTGLRFLGHLVMSLFAAGAPTGFERSAIVNVIDRRTGRIRLSTKVDHAVHLLDLESRLEADLAAMEEDDFAAAWGLE